MRVAAPGVFPGSGDWGITPTSRKYEVKRLNEQVKRNISRFPEDFMFQIEPEEVPDRLKSQFATLNGSNNKRGMHIKKMP